MISKSAKLVVNEGGLYDVKWLRIRSSVVAFCDNWEESFVSVKVWDFLKTVEYFRCGGNTLYFGASYENKPSFIIGYRTPQPRTIPSTPHVWFMHLKLVTSWQYSLNNTLLLHQPEYEANTWAESSAANKSTCYWENLGASFLPCKYVDSLVGRQHKKRREGWTKRFLANRSIHGRSQKLCKGDRLY